MYTVPVYMTTRSSHATQTHSVPFYRSTAVSQLTYEVADEGAVEVGDALHAPGHVGRALSLATRLLLVVVVAQHETEEQSRHDDIADTQHGEVAARGARENQLAWE